WAISPASSTCARLRRVWRRRQASRPYGPRDTTRPRGSISARPFPSVQLSARLNSARRGLLRSTPAPKPQAGAKWAWKKAASPRRRASRAQRVDSNWTPASSVDRYAAFELVGRAEVFEIARIDLFNRQNDQNVGRAELVVDNSTVAHKR